MLDERKKKEKRMEEDQAKKTSNPVEIQAIDQTTEHHEDREHESDAESEENDPKELGNGKLSKRQLKRLKRKQQFQEIKMNKKLKKQENGDSSTNIKVQNENPDPEIRKERMERKKALDAAFVEKCEKNFHVIIDCSWESEHSDSSLTSLTQQLMYSYGANKRSSTPAYLHFTNLGPKTMEKMQKMNCDTWLGVSTTSEDYLSNPLFSIEKEPNKKQLVYLTADAEETLESLDPAEVYIIGGIVDRNRLKGITYEKAKKQGIRAAKLPIRENVSLSSSQVLTVNHVFEILVTFPQLQDWKMTFEKVIPKRKEGGKGSKDERASDGSIEGDQTVNRQESS